MSTFSNYWSMIPHEAQQPQGRMFSSILAYNTVAQWLQMCAWQP